MIDMRSLYRDPPSPREPVQPDIEHLLRSICLDGPVSWNSG